MSETLRGLSIGSETLAPAFSPYITEYECGMTSQGQIGIAAINASRRTGQIYTVAIGSGTTSGSGAQLRASTNIGQRTYILRGGTGGTEIPASELPEGCASGTRADIVLVIKVYIGEEQVNTYTVTVHRTYLVPEE